MYEGISEAEALMEISATYKLLSSDSKLCTDAKVEKRLANDLYRKRNGILDDWSDQDYLREIGKAIGLYPMKENLADISGMESFPDSYKGVEIKNVTRWLHHFPIESRLRIKSVAFGLLESPEFCEQVGISSDWSVQSDLDYLVAINFVMRHYSQS